MINNKPMVYILKKGTDQNKLTELSRKISGKEKSNNLKRWRGSIRLKKSVLAIQKEMRDGWE
jgi:hypothetical protein